MSRPGPGQPTLLEFGISGRRPRHVRTRDGNEEWRYYPHDLDPGNRANIDEVIRMLRANRQTTIRIGIIGQLEDPFGAQLTGTSYPQPAHTTLYHAANVRRVNLIRALEAAPTLEEGLALGDPARPWTQHQWAEIYTVYLGEWVRPQ